MLEVFKQENVGKEFTLTMPNGKQGTVILKRIEPSDVMFENVLGFEDLEKQKHVDEKWLAEGTEKCFHLRLDWFQSGLCKLELV